MENNKPSRDYAIDIIKIFAAFSVISIHFLYNNGFYSQTEQGLKMFTGGIMYSLFSCCVPLFIISTGYLMGNKKVSKKYYLKLIDIVLVYVLASLFCMVGKIYLLQSTFTVKGAISDILMYSLAPYSWYVEMYIVLFLLIPFLNVMYDHLDSQKKKFALVVTLFVITTLPTVVNYFNYDTFEWWSNISSSDAYQKIIPNYWMDIYPLTYFFIGRYFKEFKPKFKTKTLLLMLAGFIGLFAVYIYYRRFGAYVSIEKYLFWNGIVPFTMAVILFPLMLRIKADGIPEAGKKVLAKMSSLTLGTYLVSYVFDKMLYKRLAVNTEYFTDRMGYFFIYVPAIFILSMLTAYIIDCIIVIIKFLAGKVWAVIKNPEKKLDNMSIAFIFFMIIAVAIAFWKSKFGFGGNDEAFYLTIPHRLSMGDTLFKDEWHLSQMSGFLTMPLVWLYRTITGSFTSVILFVRRTYIVVHALVAIFAYLRLKKYGWMSVFASISYFLFTPFNIMAFSYNTMAIDLLLTGGILLATADSKKKIEYIISGLLYAGAVLCCPYLAIVYVLFGIGVVICMFVAKDKSADSIFSWKKFGWFSFGVGILAVLFLIMFFKGAGIDDLKANLPLIFTDPEHVQVGIGDRLIVILRRFYKHHAHFKYSLLAFAMMLLVMCIDKNRKKHRAVYIIISSIISFATLLMYVPKVHYSTYNSIMFPLMFVGITAFILCEKKPYKLFAAVFVTGIIYAVCVASTSNQYFFVISMASSVSNVASAIFIGRLIMEMKERKDEVEYSEAVRGFAIGAVVCVLALLMTTQLIAKTKHCFWEAGEPKTLTSEIQNGPAKGIMTSEQNMQEYESYYLDINVFNIFEPDNLLVMSEKTWIYLALDDFNYGTYSAWLSGENEGTLNRLEAYYELNPEKIPRYIYVPYNSNWDMTKLITDLENKGYTLYYGNMGYRMIKE